MVSLLQQTDSKIANAGALALARVLKAVAVTQDNADWAKEAMLRAWFEHANSGDGVARSRVKVDFSDLAC